MQTTRAFRKVSRLPLAKKQGALIESARTLKPSSASPRDGDGLALHADRSVVRLLVRRKISLLHVVAVLADRFGNDFSNIGVLPGELRRLVEGQPQQIVQHQDLSIATP